MRTYYQILGVSEGARPDEIKHAYRRLVRQFHPDLSGGDTALPLRQVVEAYETLSDEQRRRSYDEELATRRRPSAPMPWVARPNWGRAPGRRAACAPPTSSPRSPRSGAPGRPCAPTDRR